MRRSELLLSRKFLIGILIWIAILIPESEPLRGSAVVLQAKIKATESKQTDEEITSNNGSISTTNVTKSPLTGIPQIDYLLDPNLPRELNGQNLTDYPFYSAVPDEIDFKCDGLHDGFYASVPHKCQVYHHCLFGTRYDFLCANYTAFDQKTFICHFVSEVDCDNSPKYYKRNEALYKEASTTSTTTTTTTTKPTPSTTVTPQPAANGGGMRHGGGGGGGGGGGRRRRPYYRRRRPVYEYYYDDEEYADSEYYDDDMATVNHRRNPNRKQNKDHYADNHDTDTDYEGHSDAVKPSVRTTSGSGSVYERPRTPPKIRRPVPKYERDKYDYTSSKPTPAGPSATLTTSTTTTTTMERPQPTPASKSKTSTQPPLDDEYYDDDEEYDYDEPKSVAAKSKQHMDYDFHGGHDESRRHMSRHRGRMPTRKRTDMYDDYDVKQRPKMSRRKEYTRYDMERPRNSRPASHRGRQDDTAPSYSKKRLVDTDHRRRNPEKRPHTAPSTEDDYYYDDEEEEEEEPSPPPPPKRQRRPNKATEKPKANSKTSHSKSNEQISVEPKQYELTTKYPKASILRGPKSSTATLSEEDTPRENEIPTTEHLSARTTLAYKTVKIVNNSLKDEDDGADNVSTEETKSSLAQVRPQGYIAVTRTLPKAQQQLQESRRPASDEVPSRSIAATPIRHFVISAPIRKPSHFGYFANSAAAAAAAAPLAANVSYKDETQLKLPEQPKVANTAAGEYYKTNGKSGAVAHFVKVPLQNMSAYQPVAAHGAFYVPMVEQTPQSPLTPSRKVKPVDEHHLPDTLNVISNGITYSGALVTEAKPFEGAAKPLAYRQDHRLYAVGDRLYTNSITFPHQAPSNFDITAPGPSAPADDSSGAAVATAPATAPEKKYSNLPSYNTANGDYDVTYNEAVQPSTTHSVRRYPTTTFFVQNGPTSSRRLPAEYAFNEGAFNSLNRSHNRYK